MNKWAKKFYQSAEWRNVRGYVFYRDKGLCQECLKEGKQTRATEVHHIIALTETTVNEPIMLDPDNLISLCRKHHYAIHASMNKGDSNGESKIQERESSEKVPGPYESPGA